MPPRKKAYEGRHRSDDNPEAKTPKVKADAPGKPGTGPTATRRRKPQHAADQPAPPPARKLPVKAPEGPSRRQRIMDEARDYAHRARTRTAGEKPSIAGRAAAGAAAGTATGAAIGGAPGAAAGAVIGGTGGALAGRKAKQAFKAATRASPGARRAIVAEFLVCLTIAALSPLTDEKKDEGPIAYMKRFTAIMGVFFVLAIVASAGRNAAKFAAGFGGLVTVALAVSNRNLFTKVASLMSDPAGRQGGRTDRDTSSSGRLGARSQDQAGFEQIPLTGGEAP